MKPIHKQESHAIAKVTARPRDAPYISMTWTISKVHSYAAYTHGCREIIFEVFQLV